MDELSQEEPFEAADVLSDALRNLIIEWHDERGVGYEEIISALERELYAACDQYRAENTPD